eukprot:3682209-Rhodomonas_salina.1
MSLHVIKVRDRAFESGVPSRVPTTVRFFAQGTEELGCRVLSTWLQGTQHRVPCRVPRTASGMGSGVGVLLGNYSHVMNYVSKAEQALETPPDPSITAKLRVVTGLSQLEGGKYKVGPSYAPTPALGDVRYWRRLCSSCAVRCPVLTECNAMCATQ